MSDVRLGVSSASKQKLTHLDTEASDDKFLVNVEEVHSKTGSVIEELNIYYVYMENSNRFEYDPISIRSVFTCEFSIRSEIDLNSHVL